MSFFLAYPYILKENRLLEASIFPVLSKENKEVIGMKSEYGIWGIMHDGILVEIQGELPNIVCRVEIDYLRKMFPQKGDSVLIELTDCTCFEYFPWDDFDKPIKTIRDLSEIALISPEMLYAKEKDSFLYIECSMGELKLKYDGIRGYLDTGEEVTISELDDASERYWDEFSKRSSGLWLKLKKLFRLH